jgi:hypothetical protein
VDARAPQQQWWSCPGTVELGDNVTGTWWASDSGSGLATASTGTLTFDTSRVGTFTVAAPVARDRVGQSAAPAECTYRVVYDFSWRAPFDEDETNEVDAGNIVPVRFSLVGDHGLAVLDGEPQLVPSSDCSWWRNRITETVPASTPNLAYSAVGDRYTWVLRSNASWRGDCRELVLRLNDGTEQRLLIRFR